MKTGSEATKLKVIIAAYACNPDEGSEPGMSWSLAADLAKLHDVVLVVGRQHDAVAIEAKLKSVPLEARPRLLHFPQTRVEAFASVYPFIYFLAGRSWQWRMARWLLQRQEWKEAQVVHRLVPHSFREPGYLWQKGKPTVAGPLGGALLTPWRAMPLLGAFSIFVESLRNVLNLIQMHASPRVRRSLRSTTRIMTSNSTIAANLRGIVDRDYLPFPEVTVETTTEPTKAAFDPKARPLQVIWVGRLYPTKALPLVLKALALLPPELSLLLTIVGGGKEEKRWKRLASRYGVADRCAWLGSVKKSDVSTLMRQADVMAFSSIREASGNVILEAMSQGLPVLGVDHHGCKDLMPGASRLRVPLTSPAATAAAFAGKLREIFADPTLLSAESALALTEARRYLRLTRAQQISELYLQAAQVIA